DPLARPVEGEYDGVGREHAMVFEPTMRPEQPPERHVGGGQAPLDLDQYGMAGRLREQLQRVSGIERSARIEVKHSQVRPGTRPHSLGAVAGLDDPEPLHALHPGLEVVEEDERPAGARIERPVEEVLLAALADAGSRRAGVKDAAGPGSAENR